MTKPVTRPRMPAGARSASSGRRPANRAPGTAPRETPAAVAATAAWFRSRNISALTVTIFVMIVIGFISLGPQVSGLYQQRARVAAIQAQIEAAKQGLQDMKVERQRWSDPVYIRSQARDRLYYVLPGEVSYLVMDANGLNLSDTTGTVGAKLAKKRNTATISSSILRTRKNWVDSMMQSVIRAGLDEPVAATQPLTQ